MNYIKNLIKAVVEYGMENYWNDSEIIDALIDFGITEKDFKDCGYGDFVKEYFKMDFDWSRFTEYDYNKYIKENMHDYIGCVKIGDICIDLLNREDGFIDYDFYVAHEDTGYGYKNDVFPYDHADGGGIEVNHDMPYEEFVYKAIDEFTKYINDYDKCFGYSLVEHANRPLEIW